MRWSEEYFDAVHGRRSGEYRRWNDSKACYSKCRDSFSNPLVDVMNVPVFLPTARARNTRDMSTNGHCKGDSRDKHHLWPLIKVCWATLKHKMNLLMGERGKVIQIPGFQTGWIHWWPPEQLWPSPQSCRKGESHDTRWVHWHWCTRGSMLENTWAER